MQYLAPVDVDSLFPGHASAELVWILSSIHWLDVQQFWFVKLNYVSLGPIWLDGPLALCSSIGCYYFG